MSPEQVRGQELDARTDLFSFGVVLYEMATGRTAVCGSSAGVIFDSMLNRDPVPASRLNPDCVAGVGTHHPEMPREGSRPSLPAARRTSGPTCSV